MRILSCVTLALCLLMFGWEKQLAQSANAVATDGPKDSIVVGRNLHVSKAFSKNPHGEVHLAADPKNPNILLGGSMVYDFEKNRYTVVAYSSSDGGKTWSPSLTTEDDFYHSDPAAGFGPDGSAYFLEIVRTGNPEPKWYTYFHRSKAGTTAWLPPAIFPMYDRAYPVADDTGGERQGWLYVHGLYSSLPGIDGARSPGTFGVLRSTDGGATFDPPTQLMTPHGPMGTAPAVVLSDGTLVIPFAESEGRIDDSLDGSPTKPNGWLKVITSTNGGKTLTRGTVISSVTFGHDVTSNANHFGFAADRSDGPFRDRLYAAWSNAFSGGSDIMLSYSSDKGNTWSNPVVVNDDIPPFDPAQGRVHFRPVVAVNRDGIVGVMWNDRRDSANNLDWSVRFSASLDGGETFLPSVKVSEAAFTHGKGESFEIRASGYGKGYANPNDPYPPGGPIKLHLNIGQFYLAGGHTAGLAADAHGVFHSLWVDNRTGVSQLWTAPVTVDGRPIRNGSPLLAELDDVSDKLIIVCTNLSYDTTKNTLSLDAQIQNTSEETITGPLRLRVTSLTSAAGGIVRLLSTDNGNSGVGAILDFSKLLIDNSLRRGEKSKARHLEFSVSGLRPLDQAFGVRPLRIRGLVLSGGALYLVSLDVRVFGKSLKPSKIISAETKGASKETLKKATND